MFIRIPLSAFGPMGAIGSLLHRRRRWSGRGGGKSVRNRCPLFVVCYFSSRFLNGTSFAAVKQPTCSTPFGSLVTLLTSRSSNVSAGTGPLSLLISQSIVDFASSAAPCSSVAYLGSSSLAL